jgi:lipopolysaccharide heptosyltransferase II
MREALPQAHLEYAVSDWSKPVVEGNPRLDGILDTGVSGSSFTLKQYLAFTRKVRRRHYSAIIVLDRSPLLNLLPWLAGAKLRVGIDSRGRGFALNIRSRLERKAIIKHEAEIYKDVLRAAGLDPTAAKMEFYPSDKAKSKVAKFLGELPAFQNNNGKLVVIHPGGGNNPDTLVKSKRWKPENFAQIAIKLVVKGYAVIIIGAPQKGDRDLADCLLQAVPESLAESVIDAVGMFNIEESGALFEKAALFIGNDTGLMHLAVACNTKVIAIFGPSNPVAYSPYTARGKAVYPSNLDWKSNLPLHEYETITSAQGGIEKVTVSQVWEAIESLNH